MFYFNYVDLCNRISKSPSSVAEELGFQRSAVTRWAAGSIPRQATLQKLASHFGVSVAYLLGEENSDVPAQQSEHTAEDLALLAKYRTADENTRAAIRLLLKL